MSGMARKPRERRIMDVKVLYTLSTIPNSTMVARLGRPMPIEVSNAPRLKRSHPSNQVPSSPGSSYAEGSRHGASEEPAPQFGHVTLKACLSAICIASPELVIDRRRDWSLYVTDPKEHYRWTLRQQAAAGRRHRTSNEASGSRGTSVSPSKDNRTGGSSRSSQSAPQNFEAGKGLFSWVLAEPEEGTSTVTGRIVSDAQSEADSDFSDDESDEELEVLEVVLRLSEMPAHSKNDYFETLRAFSSSASSSSAAATAPPRADTPLALITSAVGARRLRRSMADSATTSTTQSSPVKAHTAPPRPPAPTMRSSPVQRSNKERDPSREREAAEGVAPKPARGELAAQPVPAPPPSNDAASSALSNEQVQLLTLLQAYKAQTPVAAHSPAAQPSPQPERTMSQVAAAPTGPDLKGFLQALVSTLSGASPAEASGTQGALSPLAPPTLTPPVAAIPLPQTDMAQSPSWPLQPSAIEKPAAAPQRKAPAQRADKQVRAKAARAAHQDAVDAASTAATPRPANTSNIAPPGSSPILGGLTPGYESDMSHASPHPGAASLSAPTNDAATPGSATEGAPERQCYNCGIKGNKNWRYVMPSDGRASVRFLEGSETTAIKDMQYVTQYRACNACAQYFNHRKGKAHRPESVWKKAIARKRAGRSTSVKRKATEDPEEATAGSPNETDELAEFEGGEDEAAASAAKASGSRSRAFSRTLSDAVERDRKRIKTQANAEKAKPIFVGNVDKYGVARLKDFLLDENGQVRTKRAIKDNPAGRKPGRPKGSKNSVPRASSKGPRSSRKKDEAADEGRTSPGAAETSPAPSASTPAVARTFPAAAESGERISPAPVTASPAPAPGPAVEAAKGAAGETVEEGTAAPAALRSSSPPPPSSATQSASNATGVRPVIGATPAKARYGAPDHLLQSSPGTALGMLLSEGDTDWNQIGPGFTPVRRSPRKQPHGTRSGLNPYASTAAGGGQGSPSLDRSSWAQADADGQADEASHETTGPAPAKAAALADLLAINETSPITRGRLRSLRFDADAHPALFTSSDEAEGSRAVRSSGGARRSYSSSQTSPGSPTPSSASRRANAKHGRAAMSDSLASMRPSLGNHMLSAGPAKQRAPRSPSAERKSARLARSKAAAALVDDLSPFMGTITTSPMAGADDGDDEEEDGDDASVGIGSPTLGAAQRRRETKRKASAELGRVTSHSPSDIFEFLNQDALTGSKSAQASQDWEHPENVPDFFNSPASAKGSTKAAPTVTTVATTAAKTVARIPRRPLPATVEDASSSSASSSPQDGISPSSAGETPMSGMDVFEDPYGLLAMHGFGPNAHGQITADTVPQHIQTFAKSAFGAHLEQFTQQGATGVAAQIVGDGSGSGKAQIEGTSATAIPQSPSRTSPSKMLALQATPKRMRTRSQASTPLKSPDYLSAFLSAMATTPNKGGSPSKDRPHANANFSPTTAALLANFDLLPNPFLAPSGSSGSSKGVTGVNIDHATAKELFPGAFTSPAASPSKSKRRRLALEGAEEKEEEGGSSKA